MYTGPYYWKQDGSRDQRSLNEFNLFLDTKSLGSDWTQSRPLEQLKSLALVSVRSEGNNRSVVKISRYVEEHVLNDIDNLKRRRSEWASCVVVLVHRYVKLLYEYERTSDAIRLELAAQVDRALDLATDLDETEFQRLTDEVLDMVEFSMSENHMTPHSKHRKLLDRVMLLSTPGFDLYQQSVSVRLKSQL